MLQHASSATRDSLFLWPECFQLFRVNFQYLCTFPPPTQVQISSVLFSDDNLIIFVLSIKPYLQLLFLRRVRSRDISVIHNSLFSGWRTNRLAISIPSTACLLVSYVHSRLLWSLLSRWSFQKAKNIQVFQFPQNAVSWWILTIYHNSKPIKHFSSK